MSVPYIVLIFTVCVQICNGDRILGVFHTPSYSHYAGPNTLMKELARRGHDVTVITPFPQEPPLKNFRVIDLKDTFKQLDGETINLFDFVDINIIIGEVFMNNFIINATEEVLRHENVQKLLKSGEKFDLVITEGFLSHALNGIAFHFNAPYIIFNANGLSRVMNAQVGNPSSPSYVADWNLPYSSNMNFFQRLHNSLVYVLSELYQHLYVLPRHNEILHKYFPSAPHINDLNSNISLSLLTSHVSTQQPVPYVPNMINIGGIHVQPPKPLPKDLQEYLDNAKDGAILFSLGSSIKFAHMHEDKREAIFKTLAKLKQKVLLTWGDEDFPGKPSNIKTAKWLPQSDILAHPNLKLFITHGGLLSQIEAVYHGVPVLGITICSDQKLNMAMAELNGVGLTVPYGQLNEKNFSSKLLEILTNPKYQENAKIRSKIMHDEPIKPLEKAVFWVEYVLRHKGAPHLRTAALNLAWYQYLLLDVILFLCAVLASIVVLVYFLMKKLFHYKKIVRNVYRKVRKIPKWTNTS